VLSIDDLYLPHAAQRALAAAHPDNPLIQHRGQPGTHDLPLARELFTALRARQPARIPSYDKAAFAGAGDRDEAGWRAVNAPGAPSVDVVIFEGWCVGFRPLQPRELEACWREAAAAAPDTPLGRASLASVEFVNRALAEYDGLTAALDAFVHIDAAETSWVYAWREEQEAKLREQRGSGMSPEEVTRFVDGCKCSLTAFRCAHDDATGSSHGGGQPERDN
jgi:D-glycerate 3-kinase